MADTPNTTQNPTDFSQGAAGMGPAEPAPQIVQGDADTIAALRAKDPNYQPGQAAAASSTMAPPKPKFDPNQPYQAVTNKPKFDASLPYQAVEAAPKKEEPGFFAPAVSQLKRLKDAILYGEGPGYLPYDIAEALDSSSSASKAKERLAKQGIQNPTQDQINDTRSTLSREEIDQVNHRQYLQGGQGQLLSPDKLLTDEETRDNPVLVGLARMAGSLTSQDNAMIMVGTGGLGFLGNTAAIAPALAPFAKLAANAPRIVSAYFAGTMAAGTASRIPGLIEAKKNYDAALKAGDTKKAADILWDAKEQTAEAAASAYMSYAAAYHAGTGHPDPVGKAVGDAFKETTQYAAEKGVETGRAAAKTVADVTGAAAEKVVDASNYLQGKATTFDQAIMRASKVPPKQKIAHAEKIADVSEDLQAVANANKETIEDPKSMAKAIRDHLQENEKVMQEKAGATRDSVEPLAENFEGDLRARLKKFYADNAGKLGSPAYVDVALEDVVDRTMQRIQTGVNEKTGKPIYEQRAPNLFESENIRQGLNIDGKPQYNTNAKPTTDAYKAGANEAANFMREKIDADYDKRGVQGVKEFRAKEAKLIDVADRLNDAQVKAEEQGQPGWGKAIWSKFGGAEAAIGIATGIVTGSPYSAVVAVPGILAAKAYQNRTNPIANVNRAVDLAAKNPNAVATEPMVVPPPAEGQVGPPIGAPPGPTAPPVINHDLYSALSTYYNKFLGAVPMDTLQEWFARDLQKATRDKAVTPEMKSLLDKVNESAKEQRIQAEKAAQKAAEEAAKAAEKAAAAPKPKPAVLPPEATHVLNPETGKIEPVRPKAQAPSSSKEAGAQEQAPVKATQPLLEIPQDRLPEGHTQESFHHHELGHVLVAAFEGFEPGEILSHNHPKLAKNPKVSGATTLRDNPLPYITDPDWKTKYTPEEVLENTRKWATINFGGAAANELIDGIKLEDNKGVAIDLSKNRGMFEGHLGMAKEMADGEMVAAFERAKDHLRPVQDVIRDGSKFRQDGLDPNLQYSNGRLKEIVNAAKERGLYTKAPETNTRGVGEEPGRKQRSIQKNTRGKGEGEGQEVNPLNAETRAPFEKTEPHQQFPEDWADYFATFGMSPEQVAYHEAAHHTLMHEQGFQSFGTIGQEHPAAKKVGGIARADWDQSQFFYPETGYINADATRDRLGDLTAQLYAGPVADELRFGIKMENNKGAAQDFKNVNRLIDISLPGLSDAGRAALHDAAQARAKEVLTRPGVHEILSKYTNVREAGIPKEYLMTPETVQDMLKELDEAKQNGKATEARRVNERTAGEVSSRGGENVARRAEEGGRGAVPATAAQVSPASAARVRAEVRLEGVAPKRGAEVLENMKKNLGVSDDASGVRGGASFITPEGQFIHLPGGAHHPGAIEFYGGPKVENERGLVPDIRPGFMEESGAIRVRHSTGKAGETLQVSVPAQGVNPAQVEAIRRAVGEGLGRNGNLYLERGDVTPETKDRLTAHKEFVKVSDVDGMLKQIGAHPTEAAKLEPPEGSILENRISYEAMKGMKEARESEKRPQWHEAAAKAGEENGGFTISPRTGEMPTVGKAGDVYPEADRTLDHNATPADIKKFYDDHKAIFDQHPELHVGGYGKELNISALGPGAEAVGRKLKQISVYDLGKGEEIKTGGDGTQKHFPDYPLAQRLAELKGTPENPLNAEVRAEQPVKEEEGFAFGKNIEGTPDQQKGLVSTRVPSAAKSTENPIEQDLKIGREAIDQVPGMAEKMANLVREYPGVKIPENIKDPDKVLNRFVDHAKENLKVLYNSVPPERREANMKWYDSANKLASNLAEKYGHSTKQAAGVIAAMSPQKDWDMNVGLAERVNDTFHTQKDTQTSPEMLAKGQEIVNKTNWKNPLEAKANRNLAGALSAIEGKTFGELTDPIEKAAWIRLHDEAHNSRQYHSIDPATGESRGLATTDEGKPKGIAWGSLKEISKAISILEDGSRENISDKLGDAHKVRNFYNNILDPNNPAGHVTIDTHAVGAALMRPMSGKSLEVSHNFGTGGAPSSTINGVGGTYPLIADAYRLAAKDLGVQPRQLQSVVWEEIRNMFPAEMKRIPKHVDAINDIWQQYGEGKISLDKAHEMVQTYAKQAAGEMASNRAAGKISAHQFLEKLGQGGLFALAGGK